MECGKALESAELGGIGAKTVDWLGRYVRQIRVMSNPAVRSEKVGGKK